MDDHHISDSTLVSLAQQQHQRTNTFIKKFYQFVKLHFVKNEFETFVKANEANDCSLVAKYQTTTEIEMGYDNIYLNSVHIPHPLKMYLEKNHSDKDAEVRADLQDIPIVLFIHGLGGQISQFEPLMSLFSQCLEIWGIDLPGFGNSRLDFNPEFKSISTISDSDKIKILESVGKMSWEEFKTENIVNILHRFVQQHIPSGKKLVIVGHSMGTHLAIKLSKKLESGKVEALILLSPPALIDDIPAEADTETKVPESSSSPTAMFKIFTYVPFLFNSFRIWDRLEGFDSHSVLRQLVTKTNIFNKLRQLRWNLDIDSSIVLKYANGFQRASYSDLITAISKFNNVVQNHKTYTKTLIVCGLNDKVTPCKIIHDIETTLNTQFDKKISQAIEIKDVGHSVLLSKPEFTSGTIMNFVEQNTPERLHLSPAWVLRVKADILGDKWGLKNELKWMALQPISTNITRINKNNEIEIAPLLGMKTLREGDQNHLPKILESIFYDPSGSPKIIKDSLKLPNGQLIAVVDISHDIPPYSPSSFQYVKYYKCATVSKVVPDLGAIRRFIHLIDDILSNAETENTPLVVVHCHYGFNRTGFLICCYLVERLGWLVQEAVEGYKRAKYPGIKHQHFIDALYVRYEK